MNLPCAVLCQKRGSSESLSGSIFRLIHSPACPSLPTFRRRCLSSQGRSVCIPRTWKSTSSAAAATAGRKSIRLRAWYNFRMRPAASSYGCNATGNRAKIVSPHGNSSFSSLKNGREARNRGLGGRNSKSVGKRRGDRGNQKRKCSGRNIVMRRSKRVEGRSHRPSGCQNASSEKHRFLL